MPHKDMSHKDMSREDDVVEGTQQALAETIAATVLDGYELMFSQFMRVTRGASQRFDEAQWHAVHDAMRLRLTVYKQQVGRIESQCQRIAGSRLAEKHFWRQVKEEYEKKIAPHDNHLIAESFFNSVFSRVFGHCAIRQDNVFSGIKKLDAEAICADDILLDFDFSDDIKVTVRRLLEHFSFSSAYEDIERDVRRIASRVDDFFAGVRPAEGAITIRCIESLFFRNKGAYLIAYIDLPGEVVPIAIPFMKNQDGEVYADAVVIGADELSMIFSFTRSYFMVDAPVPERYVAILQRLMSKKDVFELFTAIGFAKHGKTSFFQHAVAYTKSVPLDQQYVSAPGIKGMVMLVFTLPEFDYVYKVIKDRFTPPKDMTRKQVEEKYALVKTSDRAGRMADVYEFKHLAFDRRRFSPQLLEELQREAASQIKCVGNALILKHVYVERKMTPLNLYLPQATDEETYNAIDEYGNAIKQLAAANIFPGDMLLKNFGVTRHGRVVFYDYDEICPLTECRFRKIPEPKNEQQMMSKSVWFDVKDNDVFPEEFRLFFAGNPQAKRVFNQLHADIYDDNFWSGLQQQIEQGHVADVFPYRRQKRFQR